MFEELDFPTLAVVGGAFAVGYWLVSLVISKLKGLNAPPPLSSGPPPNVPSFEHASEPPLRAPFDASLLQTPNTDPESDRHARALGLQAPFTEAKVKTAYRELLLQYHPDRVAQLGPEIREVAHRRTQEIVAAYVHFRGKLGF